MRKDMPAKEYLLYNRAGAPHYGNPHNPLLSPEDASMNHLVYTDLLRASFDANASRSCFHIKRGPVYQSWTYADVRRDLNALASALSAAGIRRGVNAAVIGENIPEWVIAHHGIVLAGGCAVPIDPNLPEAEIREIIRITEARVVFCSPVYASLFVTLSREFPFIKKVVILDGSSPEGTESFASILSSGDPTADALAGTFAPDDPAVVIFTSGTTGKAKGVVLPQRALTAVHNHAVPRMRVGPDDVMLAVLPLHHCYGFAACVAVTLTTGMSVVFVPVIKGPLIVAAVREMHVSILPAVPQMLESLYNNIRRGVQEKGSAARTLFAMLSAVSTTLGAVLGQSFRRALFGVVHRNFGGRLRLIVSGGSSLKKSYFDGFRLLGFDIVEGYGLTETFGPITLCPATRPLQASVGPVFPENEMRVDKPGADGIGEVLFRGITVFSGYYHNEDATRAVFDADGWFHTGDLGRVTEDRFLYLTGRQKDVIILNSGKNVYPDELEEYFQSSPLIDEVGVFGTTENGDEVVTAIVVPNRDTRRANKPDKAHQIIANELIRMSQSLPTYKKIAKFAVEYQPLPRTSTRKLKKPEIKALYEAAQRSGGSRQGAAVPLSFLESALVDTEEFQAIAQFLRNSVPRAASITLTPRSHLELDVGLDSLKSLDLVCMIEETFHLSVPTEALLKLETLGDAVNLTRELRAAADTGVPTTAPGIRQQLATAPAARLHLAENNSALLQAAIAATRAIGRTFWHVKVRGVENAGSVSPVIFVANHASLVDGVWLLDALPWPVRRRTFILGKSELRKSPLWAVLSRSNVIPIERTGDVVEALIASRHILSNGMNLVIHPEGTRTRSGAMGAFKPGVGTLMLETNAAVVPVRIRGSFRAWPAEHLPRFVAPGLDASVTFGAPLTIRDMQRQGLVGDTPTAEDIAESLRGIIDGM